MKRALFYTRLLLFLAALCLGASRAGAAAYTVTESWSVTLNYDSFAGGITTTKHFSGKQTGTIQVNGGEFQIIDRTGVAWSAPGQDQGLKTRSLSGSDSEYSIDGDYVFAPAYGARAYGLVFLGCFAVKVPLIDGEVPAFGSFDTFSASGPADAVSGGGNMIGSSLEAYVSSTVSLREVVGPPAISQQPRSLTLYEGQTATFSVTAGGRAPLSYLWRKGGAALPGADQSSLTITNVQAADAGGYSVIVSNPGGKVTSATAQLTVKPPAPPWFEGWESAMLGARYLKTNNQSTTIAGDKKQWVVSDTVSFFPDCGPPLNHADIVVENGRKLLKLTSVRSSGCADNIGVSLDTRSSTSLPIPLAPGVQFSFFEQGMMVNPVWNGFFNCVGPPCGDTVSLAVLDNLGNTVVYIFQRAPNYVEHTGIGYVEVFLDSAGGTFTRDLFADFARIAGPGGVGTAIAEISFGISSEGWAALDDLLIRPSSLHGDTVNPSVAIASPAAGARVSDPTLSINGTAADNTGVALVEYRLENAGGVGAYQPATGTLQWSAMVTGLIPGTNTLRVRARDVAGRYSPEIVRQVVFVVVSPLTVLISGSGVVTPALDGQLLEVGRSFTLTAKPGAGFVFSNWTGAMAPAGSPTLSFLMQSNLTLSANFVPNPFPVVAGAYAGLFWEGESVRQGSSGFFTLATTASGAYSGALILDGVKLPVSGQLSLDGGATNVIPRRGADPVSVAWTVDLHGANQVTGLVSTASWHARLAGDRALLNAGTNHTMPIGKYTFVLPGATDEPSKPEGDGFGTAGVDGNGKVNLAATLADGTRFAAAGPLLQGGMFPLYTALYGKRGSVLSWVAFDTNQPDSDMSGLFSWIRPPAVTPKTYTNGFELESALTGSRYVPPAGKTNRIVEISNGFLLLSGAGLLEPSTNAVILGPNNALTNTGSNKLTLTLTASSGLFKGTFMQTGTTERVSFSGAVLQKTRRGSGYFLRAGRSGQVLLQPQPSP